MKLLNLNGPVPSGLSSVQPTGMIPIEELPAKSSSWLNGNLNVNRTVPESTASTFLMIEVNWPYSAAPTLGFITR